LSSRHEFPCRRQAESELEKIMLRSRKRRGCVASIFAAAFAVLWLGSANAQAPPGDPIRIGFGMALTGPLAANGKMSLTAMKIWEEDVNAKGGLLGRPVKLDVIYPYEKAKQ
jgi:ABC-type branched-subunit amino acid transport system substrate-binding protein